MENNPPEHVEHEFNKALDEHEKSLRKQMDTHLHKVERDNIKYDTAHHLDTTED